jgi:hypothetical protein
LASNVPTGKWSDYITLNPIPTLVKSRDDSEFWSVVCVKKAGKPDYVVGDNNERNIFGLELPQSWTTEGKTQSVYVGLKEQDNVISVGPYYDLVQVFQ